MGTSTSECLFRVKATYGTRNGALRRQEEYFLSPFVQRREMTLWGAFGLAWGETPADAMLRPGAMLCLVSFPDSIFHK